MCAAFGFGVFNLNQQNQPSSKPGRAFGQGKGIAFKLERCLNGRVSLKTLSPKPLPCKPSSVENRNAPFLHGMLEGNFYQPRRKRPEASIDELKTQPQKSTFESSAQPLTPLQSAPPSFCHRAPKMNPCKLRQKHQKVRFDESQTLPQKSALEHSVQSFTPPQSVPFSPCHRAQKMNLCKQRRK